MANYQIISPKHPLLRRYIDHYMYVTGDGAVKSKKIFPRPGVSMVFDFTAPFYFGKNRFQKALSGLQYDSFTYATEAERADHFVIHFSAYGFSRFIDMPMDELTEQIMAPKVLLGEDINDLYERITKTDKLGTRVTKIEDFFIKRFIPPLQVEIGIFAIADRLRDELSTAEIPAVRQQISLSTRQIERKFKAAIGVDMQSFIRINRFARAKQLLLQNPSLRLTDIGLEAGYYDQPHFSNDFKKLSGVTPRRFEHCM